MSTLRAWWRNCAIEKDAETLEIDRMEDQIKPLAPNFVEIRELISSLELCHHKAEQWISHIITAIGKGKTNKGLGTRPPGRGHKLEKVWHNACVALSSWCSGVKQSEINLKIGRLSARNFLNRLGDRSELKLWQVQRVIDKIHSLLEWSQSLNENSEHYIWLLLGGDEYNPEFRTTCPKYYSEQEEFWRITAKTLIEDNVNGKEAKLSLALAIDMLWPCHWRFLTNLQIILDAIGGRLHPEQPYTTCGRNIELLPNRDQFYKICTTLEYFTSDKDDLHGLENSFLTLLGTPSPQKKWLCASLNKTIRMQMDPPAKMQKIAALEGPDWIKH